MVQIANGCDGKNILKETQKSRTVSLKGSVVEAKKDTLGQSYSEHRFKPFPRLAGQRKA